MRYAAAAAADDELLIKILNESLLLLKRYTSTYMKIKCIHSLLSSSSFILPPPFTSFHLYDMIFNN